uniref:Uncharacterized protein n=1 Tax=Acidipropionibacterium jensenii TaxID=1749 RepID=I3VZB0_9ACTN|nr:hypothetical protein [Acidipropionibacterium jensenii]
MSNPESSGRPSGPTLSMAEAARACGVSVSTVRRHRDALVAHGATRHDASWVIPLSALISCGLMPRVTPPDAPSPNNVAPAMTSHGDAPLTGEVQELRERLANAEHRTELAEAIAAERQHTIDAQRIALRALEPGSTHNSPATDEPATAREQPPGPEPSDSRPHRRSWWRRLTGGA